MSDRRMRRFALLLPLLLLAARPAAAHDFSTSYAELLVAGDSVRVTLRLGLLDLHTGPIVDLDNDGAVDDRELERAIDLITAAVEENYLLGAPAPPVSVRRAGYTLTPPALLEMDLAYGFEGAVTDLVVRSTLDRLTQENHRHLLQLGERDRARFAVLTADRPEVAIDYAAGIPFWVTMLDFIGLGVEHIFTGYDHLAFLVALLLATTTLRSLVKIVTCFTIAHSVTLGLATLGVVVAPSRLIESLIALSIAYVAIENFLGFRFVHRAAVTFGFGLVHGFGFSNILRELGIGRADLALSLFSFNLGVEIGQVAFVALLFPLLLGLMRSRWQEHVTAGLSVATMCLGFYWFVQRAWIF